ncbi:zinc ribbon domain-containing protein [Streptomyces niveus]|uniref:zinc ribbon domain-containing protein n=1 Tax=Streptomyces niveus TaxID=193462 RepID=UPI00364D44EC
MCDRWFPSSRTCSACGWQKPSLTLAERVFTCGQCGLVIDRDLNAARNIAAHAVPVPHGTAAPGRVEASNARAAAARPATPPRGGRQAVPKREDTGPPRPVPPQRSDPLTLFTLDVPDQQTAKRA